MKSLLRNFLIHLSAILVTAYLLPGFVVEGGFRTLVLGSLGLMFINFMVVPLLKIMFLPLNLLTLGFFTWVINVIGLFILTKAIPAIKLIPYHFPGASLGIISLPETDLSVLYVAIASSLLIGFISHFLQWLYRHH